MALCIAGRSPPQPPLACGVAPQALAKHANVFPNSSGACPYQGGYGTVFKLAPPTSGTWTETVLYSFTGGKDGGSPRPV